MGVYDGYLGGNKKNKRKLTQQLMGEYGQDLPNLDDSLSIQKLSEDQENTINAYDPYGSMMLVNLDDAEDDMPYCKDTYYQYAPTDCKCPDGLYWEQSSGANGP